MKFTWKGCELQQKLQQVTSAGGGVMEVSQGKESEIGFV